MIYAGIGSRKTPDHVMREIDAIGRMLGMSGHTLRSGRAKGADQGFEAGHRATSHRMELYLATNATNNPAWYDHAKKFHPVWHKLDVYGRQLMARNSPIMLGAKLDTPVDFVVCWTPNAAVKGGTGQALRIAAHHGIPVFNLAREGEASRLWSWIGGAR